MAIRLPHRTRVLTDFVGAAARRGVTFPGAGLDRSSSQPLSAVLLLEGASRGQCYNPAAVPLPFIGRPVRIDAGDRLTQRIFRWSPAREDRVRIALLHIAPKTGEIDQNRRLIEQGVAAASAAGAQWAITPELCVSGYLFLKSIGTGWINPQPDQWMSQFCDFVKRQRITVFLSHPELDPASGRMFNTVFIIGPDGEITGRHRKVKTLGGAEAWSSPGWKISPLDCDGIRTGILVCADAYKNDVAEVLVSKGAQVLVSPVAWGPGGCGPDGEWEERSAQNGLPIIVCNRTGVEPEELDYRSAESVVAQNGRRLLEATSEKSVVLTFDWDMETMTLQSEEFQRTYL